jgi:F0F1-type ATP synthase assembly protein I
VVTRTLAEAARQAQLPLQVGDEVPVDASDPHGVVPFYLAVGYVVGGYLTATALGLRTGAAPRRLRWAGLRTAALAAYAIALGVVGAVVVGPVLGIWDHDLVGVAAVGALTVFAAATVAAAIQAWLGPLGTGIVILLLVVIGNPGSGGIYAPEFLPTWLRGMHRWNATGLATDLIKSVVYFDRRPAVWPTAGLIVWTLLGVAGVLTATIFHTRRRARRAAHRPVGPPTSGNVQPDD